MLSPVCYPLFLLSMIRCCVAISDLGIQVGEPLPTLDAEPNNLFLASESPDGTNFRTPSKLPLIQSNDQCRYNTNQKSRKMRSKRGEVCSPGGQPVGDNGQSGADKPSPLPQIEPPADGTPDPVLPVLQPHPNDDLCPPEARYPVCADPAAFPITHDALFQYQLSRMQLKYCRACTYTINPSLPNIHQEETDLGEVLTDAAPAAAPSCPNPGEESWCCDFAFTVSA